MFAEIIGPGKIPSARVVLCIVSLDQTSYLTIMADDSLAEIPIRRYSLTEDRKDSNRADGSRDAPSNGYKKQSGGAKLHYREW